MNAAPESLFAGAPWQERQTVSVDNVSEDRREIGAVFVIAHLIEITTPPPRTYSVHTTQFCFLSNMRRDR